MKEKGSDVNLATELLADGYENRFDVAVLVTNDSDLVAPVKVLRQRLGLTVGVINPHAKPSAELQRCCSFVKSVRTWTLQKNQLPPLIRDAHGEIHKPSSCRR